MSTHILGEEAPAQPPAAPGDSHRRPPLPMRLMQSFRHWRKGRPFVGGLLTVLAGVELLAAPLTSLGVMIHEGVAGFSASFFGPLLVVFGLAVWYAPAYRLFAGIATILLGLIALPTINLGGFFIGTLLALIGGGLSAAWTPRPGWQAPTRRQRRSAPQTAGTATAAAATADTATTQIATTGKAPIETVPTGTVPAWGDSVRYAQAAEIDEAEAEPKAPSATADDAAEPAADGTPTHELTAPAAEADPMTEPTAGPEADRAADQSGSTEESGAHLEE
jgi:hypothetical protein